MSIPPLFHRTLEIQGAALERLRLEEDLDPRWPELWPVAFGQLMSRAPTNELVLVEELIQICRSPAELDAAVAWQEDRRRREDARRAARSARHMNPPGPPAGRWDLERER